MASVRGVVLITQSAIWLAVALATVLVASDDIPAHAGTLVPAAPPVVEDGVVRYIGDGDTFHVTVKNRDLNVRLLGVDTPETTRPCTDSHDPQCVNGKIVQCGGPQAVTFAVKVLYGRQITLVPDPTQPPVDRYGRALRYIRVPGLGDYSLAVLRAGWARVQTGNRTPVSEYDQLEQAQTAAIATRRGLWGICSQPAPGD